MFVLRRIRINKDEFYFYKLSYCLVLASLLWVFIYVFEYHLDIIDYE